MQGGHLICGQLGSIPGIPGGDTTCGDQETPEHH